MNDEDRKALSKVALSQYANEPCRICGKNIDNQQVETAVFAGYSADSTSRAAHKECWDARPPQSEWVKR